MNQNPSTDRFGGIYLCIALFALVDFLIWRFPLFLTGWQRDVIVGLMITQVSLSTLWANVSKHPLPLRFASLFCFLVATWYFFLVIIFEREIDHRFTAIWLFGLVLHSLIISIACQSYLRFTERDRRPPFAFNLNTILCWTAVSAACFGIWQFGSSRWDWYLDTDAIKFGWSLAGLLSLAAVITCPWLWAFLRKISQWRGDKIVITICVFALLCVGGIMAADKITTASKALFRPLIFQNCFLVSALSVITFAGRRENSPANVD